MIILSIRTDKPESEIGLHSDTDEIASTSWQAHRQLAETIHVKINDLLKSSDKGLKEVDSIVCYKGPGSFTGLRIGLSVANAMASGLDIPIIGETGDDWQKTGIDRLLAGQNDTQVMPEYGAPVHITKPKK